MDTFLEMQTAVSDDLTVDSTSSLYNTNVIKRAINRAYRKAGGLFRWPELEDAKKTSTQSGYEYYEYPQNWQPDSIWKVEVDGERYGEDPDGSPISFDDYLNWKKDNPNSTEKKWSSQWRRYFIHPTPTSNGDNNLYVWGQKAVTGLTENTDITIFSYSMPECNEAIVLEAVAILKAKGEEETKSAFRSQEAKQILSVAYGKIRQNQNKYEKIQPMWNVPDMFGRRRTKSLIGQF